MLIIIHTFILKVVGKISTYGHKVREKIDADTLRYVFSLKLFDIAIQ